MPATHTRPSISISVQVRVFVRDRWLCRWCHRPVVFSPALRLLQELVKDGGHTKPVAYFHSHWSRQSAPLLDHLGAVVDHVEAFSMGGSHELSNFATSCNKCNARKNNKRADEFTKQAPGKPVRGKYGEPSDWDGLASLFLVLAAQGARLNAGERRWLGELRSVYEMGGA